VLSTADAELVRGLQFARVKIAERSYTQEEEVVMQAEAGGGSVPGRVETWNAWPVYWSAIWVGVLSALAVSLLIGLMAVALGAHQIGARGIAKLSDVGPGGLVFAVIGPFIAFVVGGWVTSRVAGIRRSEPAMLHAGIVWLVAMLLLVAFAAMGAGPYFGGWYSGLAGTPAWASTQAATPDPAAAMAIRNGALAAITALLIGLIGSVLGGWMGSGEPMSLTAWRARETVAARRPVSS
jgi:hypothetical protein